MTSGDWGGAGSTTQLKEAYSGEHSHKLYLERQRSQEETVCLPQGEAK